MQIPLGLHPPSWQSQDLGHFEGCSLSLVTVDEFGSLHNLGTQRRCRSLDILMLMAKPCQPMHMLGLQVTSRAQCFVRGPQAAPSLAILHPSGEWTEMGTGALQSHPRAEPERLSPPKAIQVRGAQVITGCPNKLPGKRKGNFTFLSFFSLPFFSLFVIESVTTKG